MARFLSAILTLTVAILMFVILLALFAVLYILVAAPVLISGNSMYPNYRNGQYWITNKLTYRQTYPNRYDVVIFNMPGNKNTQLISRVIALPGETVQIIDNSVYVNQSKEDGSYLSRGSITNPGLVPPFGQLLQVPDDHYFVLGDNRLYSIDSRVFGTVPKNYIVGKIWFCYWNCFE